MAKSVARNALFNGLRTVSSMLFPIITYPYVTRVLMADNLGKVDFTASIVSYFTLVAGLGIASYATRDGAGLREDRATIDEFSSQVFTVNLCSTAIAYALLAVLLIAWPRLRGYGLLMGIQSLTILGTTIGVDWVFAIHEEYGYITARTIAVQAISAVLLFALVRRPQDYIVYAGITVFSGVGANVFNFFRARRYVTIRPTWHFDPRRHLAPMLVLFGNTVAVTVYVNTDVTLLGIFRGDREVGLYSVAVRVYVAIKQLLNSLVTVSVPRLSLLCASGRRDEFQGLLESVAHGLVVTVVPVLAMLYLMAEYVVAIVGGPDFLPAAQPLRILCLAGVFAVFACYVTNAVLLPNRGERQVLHATVVGAVVNLALNLVVIPAAGIVGAAITTLVAELAVFAVASRSAAACCDAQALLAGLARPAVTSLLCLVAMCTLFAVVSAALPPSFAGFFASGGTLVASYAVVLLARRDTLAMRLLSRLRGSQA